MEGAGFRGLGFRDLGFRGLGFRGLGFGGLGFRGREGPPCKGGNTWHRRVAAAAPPTARRVHSTYP